MREKRRRRPRRRGKTPWSEKHAQRVDIYPSMDNLVEMLYQNSHLSQKAAETLMRKHDLESTIAPLIAMREIINERIATEAERILRTYHNDDVADVKILIWHFTTQAREYLQENNPDFAPHMADGLHPQSAAILSGVKLEQIQ